MHGPKVFYQDADDYFGSLYGCWYVKKMLYVEPNLTNLAVTLYSARAPYWVSRQILTTFLSEKIKEYILKATKKNLGSVIWKLWLQKPTLSMYF